MVKQNRHVFHSMLTPHDGWVVLLAKEVQSKHANQLEAEAAANAKSHAFYEAGGLGRAVFHKADGTIREERTYGEEYESTPG